MLDGHVRVHHERLLGQHDFLLELVDLTFDDLFDHVVRTAFFLGLFDQDSAFLLDGSRVEVRGVQRQRSGRGNVHGDLAAQFTDSRLVTSALDGDQNADAADARRHSVMDVGRHGTFGYRQAGRTTQSHILTDGGDQLGHFVSNGAAVFQRGRRDSFDAVVLQAQDSELLGSGLEQVIAGDEVGFSVEFDGRSSFASTVFLGSDSDDAFSGDAVSLLGGLGQAFGAQPVDRCFNVAVVFNQRLLAVHHADARTLAKFLHKGGSDLGHVLLLKIGVRSGDMGT